MFSFGFNPTSNQGFANQFDMSKPYSPTLSNANYSPGMINMQQPTPSPMGGSAPGMASTANGIGGGSAMPGNPGSLSPGLLAQFGQIGEQGTGAALGASMPGAAPAAAATQGAATGTSQGMSGGGNTMQMLAQLGGGLMAQGQPRPEGQAPPPGEGTTYSGQNSAMQKLLAQYGISGGLLGSA